MPETERQGLYLVEPINDQLQILHLVLDLNETEWPVRTETAPGLLERTLEGVALRIAGILGGTDPMTIFVALEKRVFGNHEPENPYTAARGGDRY